MFDNIAHPAKRAFLAAFAGCGNVSASAEIAGVSRELHYDWKAQDRDYALAFAEATERAADALEDEAHKRATTGGSDKILMFLLRGVKRSKYGTTKVDQTIDARLAVSHQLDLTALDDSDLHTLQCILAKADAGGSGGGAGAAREIEAAEPADNVLPFERAA